MRYRRVAILTVVFIAAAFAGKKKNPDGVTQVLELPKDPPMIAIGATSRLVFHVSPLSGKGLLSQQTRDALKAILKANGGAPVIHIRAFVAGSGDLRRVPQIVSEVFTAKKMPLPSVSVVLAGGLPLEDAQIEIEAVSEAKDARKDVNPSGLNFLEAAPPDQLISRLAASTPLQVTCFVSSLDGAGALAARFPSAAVDIVQTQRMPARPDTRCEAVARGGQTPPRLAFTGTQVAFGSDQKAAALAYKRLDQELTTAGISPSDILETHVYALSERLGTLALNARDKPTALTVVAFEGVASLDGSFAIDYIARMK
jgi:enamine deaminase RidA (YjgF/YER057c/UK114 family)